MGVCSKCVGLKVGNHDIFVGLCTSSQGFGRVHVWSPLCWILDFGGLELPSEFWKFFIDCLEILCNWSCAYVVCFSGFLWINIYIYICMWGCLHAG